MQTVFDIARVSFGLLLYLAAYILPLTLVLSVTLRLLFGWRSDWRWLTAALGLALFAAFPGIWLGPWLTNQSIAMGVVALLALIAAGVHFRATRGHRSGYKRGLDLAFFVLVLGYTLININWIVG